MFQLTFEESIWTLSSDDGVADGFAFSDKDLLKLGKALQSALNGVESTYYRDNGKVCKVQQSNSKANRIVIEGESGIFSAPFLRITFTDARKLVFLLSGLNARK